MQKKKELFSTQEKILRKLGKTNCKGICSPLANLFANYKMGTGTREFLDYGASSTYAHAKKMEEHQSEIKEQVTEKYGRNFASLLALHACFYDNNIMFKGERVPVGNLSTTEGAKNVLEQSEHVLVNYPTNNRQQKTSPFHQVYYGHTAGTNRCSYFNANIPGGEREGNCNEILHEFVDDIQKSAARDGRECIVGRSIPS